MSSAFRMPSLGADMEAGRLVEWLKRPGEAVHRGDIIAVVETQKGAIEVEVFEEGRVEKLLVREGTEVPVGTPLALLTGPGEASAERVSVAESAPAATVVPTAAPVRATPTRGPSVGGRQRASPAARRLASERGLELADLQGSGPGGAIVSGDVPPALAKPEARAARRIDMTEMRKAIAAAMARSKREIPHYYLAHSFDLTAAADWLARTNEARPPARRLLMGALYLKAAALALRDYPEFNGFHRDGAFAPSAAIHVGAAVAIRGGGLIAPAIHHTDRLELDELMARMRDLVARVRSGGLRSSELADPTVTVSSLGDRGVDTLYGVIYPPQVAILGFGKASPRPWAREGAIGVAPVLTLTLSADHRVSDGHRGALLLARIEALLQRPEAL